MAPLAVGALALVIRLLFVLWAPGQATGDGSFYHAMAVGLSRTGEYRWMDGSPAVQWMPGWPVILGGLYAVFGEHPKVGMVANAVFGAGTAAMLAVLGRLAFDRRTGWIAGLLYAVWPGNVYFAATLFTEPTFTLLLATWMALLAAGARSSARMRMRRWAASGLALGACAMVKAEPLVLLPWTLLFLWSAASDARELRHAVAITVLATALVVAPWMVRNYVLFGRVMVTSASGGMVAWLGVQPPERSYAEARSYLARQPSGPFSSRLFAASAQGWGDAWHFARSQPAAWWAVQRAKLAETYGSDDEGATIVRGARKSAFLEPATHDVLVRIANGFWWIVLTLAALGLGTIRAWWLPVRILILAVPLSWLVTHVLMVAGPRFHAPETLSFALLAARALRGRIVAPDRPAGQRRGLAPR